VALAARGEPTLEATHPYERVRPLGISKVTFNAFFWNSVRLEFAFIFFIYVCFVFLFIL